MQNILENAMVAERKKRPMCDDTGIPHLLLEIGPEQSVDYEMLEDIKAGISEGLKLLPGRPMAVKGDYRQVIEQKIGLYDESEAVEAAPIILKTDR